VLAIAQHLSSKSWTLCIGKDHHHRLDGGNVTIPNRAEGWAQRISKEVVTEVDLHTNVMPAFYLGIRF
jgi:hypothetical protein